MEDPIIACDVSKGKSHIQGFIGLSKPVGDPFVVRHLKNDLKLVKELAKSLELETHQKPKFVFEFTGIYHECIAKYVQSLGLDLYAISPLESAKVRKSQIRVTKTDSKDCLNIATVYYTRRIRKFESDNNDIKSLSRSKRYVRSELVKQKVVYHRYLDLVWPCFDEFFSIDTIGSNIIVSTYKHPFVIRRRSTNMIADVLLNNGKYSKTRAFDLANKVKDYAAECVSGVDENSEYVKALITSFNKVQSLKNEIDNINNKMDNILRKSFVYKLLNTIPGIGANLLIQMTAEIGDYTRFKTAKQFVAYIGLDPSILQSGTNDGKHYSITRKGNGILRSCLYLTVSQMLVQEYDNQITRFYYKKKSSGLSHKVAAVASCRKLACCVFGMLNSGTCFETI